MNDEQAAQLRRRYNFLRLYSVMPRNPKVAGLTDGQFRAYIYALCSARDEQVRGEWIDRTYLAAALGKRYARHIDALVQSTLLTEDPDGVLRVRQWLLWNPEDETNAQRQAEWRARQKADRQGSQPVTARNALSNAEERRQEARRPEGESTRLDMNRDGSSADNADASSSSSDDYMRRYDAEVAAKIQRRLDR